MYELYEVMMEQIEIILEELKKKLSRSTMLQDNYEQKQLKQNDPGKNNNR